MLSDTVGSKGSEEHVIGDQRSGDPCYIVENLVNLSPAIAGKAELVNTKIRYIAKEIYKQRDGGWSLFLFIVKCRWK